MSQFLHHMSSFHTSFDINVVSLDGSVDGRNSRRFTNTKGTVEGINIKTLGNIRRLRRRLFLFLLMWFPIPVCVKIGTTTNMCFDWCWTPPPILSKLLCIVCECNRRGKKETTSVKTKVTPFPINFDFLGEGFPVICFHVL